jgi:RibD domain-containing protein
MAEYEQMSMMFTELYPDVPLPKNTWQWVESAQYPFRQTAEIMSSGIDPTHSTSGTSGRCAGRRRSSPPCCRTPSAGRTRTIVSGNAVDIVARLEQRSDGPLRSPGSLSLNWALMAAGLVDRLQVTTLPVIADGPGRDRFSGARATSTSSCSRAGRSMATLRNASIAPLHADGTIAPG